MLGIGFVLLYAQFWSFRMLWVLYNRHDQRLAILLQSLIDRFSLFRIPSVLYNPRDRMSVTEHVFRIFRAFSVQMLSVLHIHLYRNSEIPDEWICCFSWFQKPLVPCNRLDRTWVIAL